ncbi:MAG: ATP-binding cassette domain-containing protein [Acidobacteriota bacterium]|nr:ATP-binding cassette domain-containing protein [Acidobacteriota bacterium]
MILSIEQVSKSFGSTRAVQDVSFEIPVGQISGLLGPNGAGKTTLIRMIMDIFKPDSGVINLGQGLTGGRKDHIGYLPEERGLYGGTKVRETLIYFAELKGLKPKEAAANADHFLDQLAMTPVADHKIGKLSKGNQQKIQLISAMIARPRLLILDEPFSGLDPVNANLVAQLIRQLQGDGVTIVLSTHQMAQAETFCQNIFLINKGQLILSGPLEPVIARYSGHALMVEGKGELPASDLYSLLGTNDGAFKIELAEDVDTRSFLGWLSGQAFEVTAVKPYRVPLAEIFIREVQSHA